MKDTAVMEPIVTSLQRYGLDVSSYDGESFKSVSACVPARLVPYICLKHSQKALRALYKILLQIGEGESVRWGVAPCGSDKKKKMVLSPTFSSSSITKQSVRIELARFGKALQELEL